MTTAISGEWPLNELGEIVVQQGVGTTNVVGYVPAQQITADKATNKVVMVGVGGGGGLIAPVFSTDVTLGRTILTTDLQNLLVFNSASNATFTIPTDTILGLSGNTNAYFEIYQKSTGVPSITVASGVTLSTWTGYPTSSQYVTQFVHRVGPNTWAVK